MKTLLLLLLLCSPAFGQAVWNGYSYNGPVCSNPRCAMCNSIKAQLAQQRTQQYTSTQQPVTPTVTSTSTPVSYTTRQAPYTYQVKVCHGTYCTYETRTAYRTERVPTTQSSATPPPTPPPTPVTKPTKSIPTLTSLPAAQQPTPHDILAELLPLLAPPPGKVVADLGCGDGRVLAAVSQTFCERTVGIELDPELARQAQASVDSLKLTDLVRVYQGDILKYDLTQLDIVYMYQYPDLIKSILPKLKSGTKVVSYIHPLPDSTQHGDFYVWIKP